jgi:hypothetical protein
LPRSDSDWRKANLDKPRIPIGLNFPLVGKRAARRVGPRFADGPEGSPAELYQPARAEDYGFPVDWWAGGATAALWESESFPLDATPDSIGQWVLLVKEAGTLDSHKPAVRQASCRVLERALADAWLICDVLAGRTDRLARDVVEGFIAAVGGVAPSGYSHSPDFCSVRFAGRIFEFTTNQRIIVEMLWTAWECGSPIVSYGALQEKVDTDTRIIEMFKGHPAWNTLIIKSDQLKDACRLALPDRLSPSISGVASSTQITTQNPR